MVLRLDVATCSWGEFRGSMGVPVRISNGTPRAFKSAGSDGLRRVPEFMPEWSWVRDESLTEDAFRELMVGRLGEVGEAGVAQLSRAAEVVGGARLVLLCYEKLSRPGMWCHRSMVAGWLADRFGLVVPELGSPRQETLL